MITRLTAVAVLSSLMLATGVARAEALVTYDMLSPETAMEVVHEAMKSCQKKGYQVSVVVVDRMGVTQASWRDRFAGPHTPETAWRKARTAVSFRADTLSLVDLTKAGKEQAGARFIPQTLMIGGGVPIEAGGNIVGGVGVSGSPGGKEDDSCARAGIDAVQEKLNL